MQLPLGTERLLLRPFTQDDVDALHAIFGDEEVNRYLDHGPLSRDGVVELIDRISSLTAIDDAHDGLRVAAVLRESGQVIGDLSLWRPSREHAQGEIGFVIHPEHQGRGYALEGMRELLRVGFEEGRLHRVVARCAALNLASAGLMERLGMRREAHFRENQLIKAAWSDELVYAILASEWQPR